MKNKMTDVRNILIEAMEKLNDKEAMDAGDMTIERAKALVDLGQVIVNSAKVEVDFLQTIGDKNYRAEGTGTGFILPESTQNQS